MAGLPLSSWGWPPALPLWRAQASSPDSLGCGDHTLAPSGFLDTASPSPLPGLTSKTQASAPSPRPPQWMSISGWGVPGDGPDHLCRSLSALSSKNPLLAAFSPKAPPLSRLISSPVRGLPSVWKPFLFHSSLPGVQVLSCFLSLIFSFFSFVLPSYMEIFLLFWKSEVFCQHSVNIL